MVWKHGKFGCNTGGTQRWSSNLACWHEFSSLGGSVEDVIDWIEEQLEDIDWLSDNHARYEDIIHFLDLLLYLPLGDYCWFSANKDRRWELLDDIKACLPYVTTLRSKVTTTPVPAKLYLQWSTLNRIETTLRYDPVALTTTPVTHEKTGSSPLSGTSVSKPRQRYHHNKSFRAVQRRTEYQAHHEAWSKKTE